ncbi:polysaccharide pyruvyl transferase family protein [Vibrio vulnificus]|uniref:polysaccharide pyruvyl transferase family protein n=1 Tax=Vibrio vulnificus TaxID=672 RepID=UPI004059EAEF
MKVGIITIHNVSNYGAVLQAFALKETVCRRHECYIIDFDNPHVSKSLKHIRLGLTFHAFLGMGKDILRILPRSRVIPKFKRFIFQKMNLVELNSLEISEMNVFISGSDQIWNPACVSPEKKFVSQYFLSFAEHSQKKISYASSCGAYEFNNDEVKELKRYLSSYKSLAVREKKTSEFLSNTLNRNVSHVLDPTLLLTKKEWLDKISDNSYRTGDYILVYVIKKTQLLKDTIRKIKSRLNMRVILVEQGLYFDSIIDEHIRDAGPEDFISLVNNAKFIITDSFHGTTFSVIFNKPFCSVSPGANVNRISSLLNTIGLENRIIHDHENIDNISLDMDFEEVNKLLFSQIEKSKEYLYSSIEK